MHNVKEFIDNGKVMGFCAMGVKHAENNSCNINIIYHIFENKSSKNQIKRLKIDIRNKDRKNN